MPKSAFTLLELLIVITIVVILASAMVPLFKTNRDEVKIAKARLELEALAFAARQAYYDTNFAGEISPGNLDDSFQVVSGWKGPYITKVNLDPWGENYFELSLLNVTNKVMRVYYCSNGPNKEHTPPLDGDDISVYITSYPSN